MRSGTKVRRRQSSVPGVDLVRSGVTRIRAVRNVPISRSRVMIAVKAGVSSMAAWYAAHLVPGADPYAYYGPFGAVIAMTFSIADSIRQSIRALVAIGLGAGLALGSNFLLPETGIAVGLMIIVGVILGAWRTLGTMGQWIPFTALFVLIVGGDDPARYIASYAGLTLLGAAIATAVNVAVPPMPVSSFGPLENRIRRRLADHFDGLSSWLTSEGGQYKESEGERQVLAPLLVELWDATDRTADARRINPRARWHESRAARQYEDAGRLERLIYLAQEIGELVSQGMDESVSDTCLDVEARERVARSLAALSRCLRWADVEIHARRNDLAEANRVLRGLEEVTPENGGWLVMSIVVSTRRSMQVLMPEPFSAPGR